MNIKEALNFGKQFLNEKAIEDSTLKCKMLLSNILEVKKEYLLIHDLDHIKEEQEMRYKEYLIRLAHHEPIQYIIHRQEFMKLDFYVDENVLIPQPDTEILVEKVIEICNSSKKRFKILDLCTGSGAIAISITKYINSCLVVASDISKNALEIARKNAKDNGVDIQFIESDLFDNLENYQFDMIVSNPPYIQSKVIKGLAEEVKREPQIALDGGDDGLEFYRKIAKDAKKYLNQDGILALEIGYDQKSSVNQILKQEKYKQIENIKDLGNNDRVVICRR